MQKLIRIFKMILLCYILMFLNLVSKAQKIEDSVSVKLINSMRISEQAWNSGDLEKFMHNYWKSDSLKFIGKRGITYGWQNTLERYKKGYPDKDSMGKLKFDILSIENIDENNILMTGKWTLQRKIDVLDGYFSLLWRKINGEWKITMDHSS